MVVYMIISKTSRLTWASLREAAWTRICTSNKYTKSHRNFLLASCILGAFLAEVSCIRFFIVVCSFVMPSNCSNRFRIATRSWCNSSYFCGPLVAKGEETDLSRHGDDFPPSDNSSSRILFSAGGPAQCLLGGSKDMVLFSCVLQPGQRDLRLVGIINTKNTIIHGASESNDTTHEDTNEMWFLAMHNMHHIC